jgi:hypothetical protein
LCDISGTQSLKETTMSRRPWHPIVLGALLAAMALPALAVERPKDKPRANDANSTQAAPAPAASPADAPNARIAALIRRDGKIIRNKGVSAVQRIDVGVYCITPRASSGVTPSSAVVVLTPEYYYSLYNEIKVQWATQGSGCGGGKIGVYTLADANLDGVYTRSNAVSFSIIVP